MVIECNQCHARYNVDENKIPPSGVKVRCHKCQNVIVIQKEPAKPEPSAEPVQPDIPSTPDVQPPVTHPQPPSSPPTEPQAPGVPEPEAPVVSGSDAYQPPPPDVPADEPEAPDEQPEPETPDVLPSEPEPPETSPPVEEPSIEEPVAVQEPPFEEPAPQAVELSEEDKKWSERARRLAKALASDLVLYNQDKVEEGLRNGTLADLLGSEIRRSWEYYCQQIPKHIIESTDHFKDQLNKIVGKGKEIFK